MAQRSKLGYFGIASVVVAGALVGLAGSGGDKAPVAADLPKDPELEALSSAAFVCERFIPETLNDPESAEFVDQATWFRKRLSETEFQVIVKMRARNAFNALTYGEIDCRVEHRDGNWRLLSAVQN